eukprot:COSAG02_NODE_1651_length_11496_cov_9.620460_1_plen_91_part_10
MVRDTPAPARQLDGTYIAVGPALTDGGEQWTEKTQIGVPPSDLAEAILDTTHTHTHAPPPPHTHAHTHTHAMEGHAKRGRGGGGEGGWTID